MLVPLVYIWISNWTIKIFCLSNYFVEHSLSQYHFQFWNLFLFLYPSFFLLPPLLSLKNSINKPPNFTSTQTHINPSQFSTSVDKSKANPTLAPTITDLIRVLYVKVRIFTFSLKGNSEYSTQASIAVVTIVSAWVLGWLGFLNGFFVRICDEFSDLFELVCFGLISSSSSSLFLWIEWRPGKREREERKKKQIESYSNRVNIHGYCSNFCICTML